VGRDQRRARQARRTGAIGLLGAIVLPLALWWDIILDVARVSRWELQSMLGWVPWGLMLAGVLFFIPVALSEGADPEGRFYPRSRNAYLGWALTLYLLGFLLATQVARLHDGAITA
jgi:hypothetical protein